MNREALGRAGNGGGVRGGGLRSTERTQVCQTEVQEDHVCVYRDEAGLKATYCMMTLSHSTLGKARL